MTDNILPIEQEKKGGKKQNKPAESPADASPSLAEEVIAATFAANPECAYLYFTQNGQAFFTEEAAQNHSDNAPIFRIDNPNKKS